MAQKQATRAWEWPRRKWGLSEQAPLGRRASLGERPSEEMASVVGGGESGQGSGQPVVRRGSRRPSSAPGLRSASKSP